MSTSYVSVAMSWGLVVVVGGVATYVYKPDLVTRFLPAARPQQQDDVSDGPKATSKRKSKKPKTAKESAKEVLDQATNSVATAVEGTSRSSKKRKITAPVDKTVTVTTIDGQKRELPRDTENESNDHEFAEQLAKAQAGTKLQSKGQQMGGASGRLTATVPPGNSTTAVSSTTGHDADDDLSSVESPQHRPSSGKDISDMLEAPGAAPATLRLTNVSEEKKKAKQAPKQFEQVQSKKKRNEQARREEQKRINQESDRLHEQRKQEHLRRARMSEGTSNQTKANNFTANTTSVWQNKNPNAPSSQSNITAPLLDTFEASSPTKESVQAQPLADVTKNISNTNNAGALKSRLGEDAAGAVTASAREKGSWADQMSVSEEEQLAKVREQQQEDTWESVQSKKSKKKSRKDGDTSSEASFARSESLPPLSKVLRPATNGVKTSGATKPKENDNRFSTIQTTANGLQEDDWEA